MVNTKQVTIARMAAEFLAAKVTSYASPNEIAQAVNQAEAVWSEVERRMSEAETNEPAR